LLVLLSGAPAAEPRRTLRVVTVNVLHGGLLSGWWSDGERLDERLAMIAAELRALDPDIVGVQEASVGPRRGDVPARLAAALGFAHVFAPVRWGGRAWFGSVLSTLAGFDEGPAVLSRFPIRAWEARAVRACGELWPRMLLCAELDTPWGSVDACSTHVAGDICQAESLRDLLAARRRAGPLLVTGDLNAREDSDAVRLLIRDLGLVDTFRLANPDAPGLTVGQWVLAAAPTVRRRVDYVLVGGGGLAAHVVASRVVLDVPRRAADGSTLWPSDHYGVLSEIELVPRP
jgi:endonuclease/exonuclease/phosphatase family metal-dependent hydrolase